MDDRTPHWQAWVDGCAVPNPGRLGIGLILTSPDGVRREHARALGCSGCNNEAEVRAVAAALTLAGEAGAQRLTIHSDSRFAVDCLNGRDTTETSHLAGLLARTRADMAGFAAVAIVWLPRHRNTNADRLARAALGLPPKSVTLPAAGKRRRR